MPSSSLAERRDQASAAAGAAEQAQASVTELDNRLQTNASMTTQQTQALRNAVAEATRLKRSLKAGARERDRLTKSRKKAAARADKADAKARTADAKYSKSVLADLVRREKEKASAPAAEQPNPAVTSATRTAARKTAVRARKTATA